jgi:hypothetical protein
MKGTNHLRGTSVEGMLVVISVLLVKALLSENVFWRQLE